MKVRRSLRRRCHGTPTRKKTITRRRRNGLLGVCGAPLGLGRDGNVNRTTPPLPYFAQFSPPQPYFARPSSSLPKFSFAYHISLAGIYNHATASWLTCDCSILLVLEKGKEKGKRKGKGKKVAHLLSTEIGSYLTEAASQSHSQFQEMFKFVRVSMASSLKVGAHIKMSWQRRALVIVGRSEVTYGRMVHIYKASSSSLQNPLVPRDSCT